jgi:hypothetical protein
MVLKKKVVHYIILLYLGNSRFLFQSPDGDAFASEHYMFHGDKNRVL